MKWGEAGLTKKRIEEGIGIRCGVWRGWVQVHKSKDWPDKPGGRGASRDIRQTVRLKLVNEPDSSTNPLRRSLGKRF